MKGQGALEYLMTYGWALLVIVVVGAALFALGILNPGTYTQSRCNGFQYFTFQDQKMESNGYTIEIINGPKEVNITGISVDGNSLTLTPTVVAAGNKVVLTATGSTGKSSGDTFSSTVTISYDVINGISGLEDSATCTGKVQ